MRRTHDHHECGAVQVGHLHHLTLLFKELPFAPHCPRPPCIYFNSFALPCLRALVQFLYFGALGLALVVMRVDNAT